MTDSIPNPGPDVTIDWNRAERVGHPELIYGASKSADQLQRIAKAYADKGQDVLMTRVSPEKAAAISVTGGSYDAVGQTWLRWADRPRQAHKGPVAIVSAGTSDAAVVEECRLTCAMLGIHTAVIQDVGVAGIHRLFNRLDEITSAQLVIVVAGFEGALASVIAGLVATPVIGVPAPVGYGIAEGGHAALNAMLASCAGGLTVVNIGNGCGAAMAADRILTQAAAP